MRSLKVDRLESKLVICTDKEKRFFAIEKAEIPQDVKPGDIIEIDDNGVLTVNVSAKKRR